MSAVEVTQTDHPSDSVQIQKQWPAPLNGREWDRVFPGVMDGIGVLGGGANVIMQLALMPVGYGVADSKVESGALFKHPIKRARTTFAYLAVAMMGTTEEKLAYRKAVNKSHAQVRSAPGDKVQYNAFNPELQLWVAACLYWGFIDTYGKLNGVPDRAKLEEFYRMAEPLGTTLQVRPGMWPQDLEAFDRYWQAGLDKLQIDDKVRTFLTRLVDLKFLHPILSRPFGPFHRFITTGFLPQPVRDQMHLPWDPAKQQNFDRFMKTVGAVNRLMPRLLRQFPFNLVMWDFRRRLRKGLPLV